MRRFLPLLVIVLGGVMAAGCDAIAGALGVDKIDVPLASAGDLDVTDTGVGDKETDASRDGGKLPNVFDIESVDIQPSNLTFTSSVGKNDAAMASGTIWVSVLLRTADGWMPFVSGTVTITNNVVTAVTPELYAVSQQVQTACAQPGMSCPELSSFQGKTRNQIATAIKKYIRESTSIRVKIKTRASQGLRGKLRISAIRLNLDY